MNCLLRPDLCDEIRQRIKGGDGITPMVPTNSSDSPIQDENQWTPPTSQLFSEEKDVDLTSHVVTALLDIRDTIQYELDDDKAASDAHMGFVCWGLRRGRSRWASWAHLRRRGVYISAQPVGQRWSQSPTRVVHGR